jgi:stage V sporulation protein SpoVS
MLLSCLDAFLTLMLLQRGMIEANPVMSAALGQGVQTFAISKLFMTGTGILILVFLAKFYFMNRVRTGLLLTIVFSVYCCLICYELVNLLAVL